MSGAGLWVFIRQLGPLMVMTWQWWRKRSRMAVARTSSVKTWPHSVNALLLVMMTESFLVAAGDDLEDEVGVVAAEGEVADLVDDQDGCAQVAAELAAEVAGLVGVAELRTMSSRVVK